ncbi:RNA polymerase sigma factor [Myxococcus sp. CA039A]|uniref:RNA polymerase sigma factor n=1 Tax=Myxococcus sp. CA039A TaxID=2741737 RepID=UPI00157B718E|nr:RNA polymerase sigma factor [Myxococcus sp. CA039A]NTX54912.1 RNA polymerase sigma factor [Myxococcus sp. CA039A]
MRQEKQQQAGAFAMQRQARLMAQAMNLCGDETDAEDLVQEVILRFIQEFGRKENLPSAPSGEAWLVRTLANLFFGQCRRLRTRMNGARDPALSAEALDVEPPPAYEAITSEQFSEALDSLSPKIRETHDLRAAGRKYEEIATLLGIPVGTVKKRLHDARTKLREYLQTFLTPGVP